MPQAGGLKAPEHYGIPNPIWAVWQKITDDKFSGTEYFMLYWVSVGISVIYSELLRLNLISNGVAIWLFFIDYILPVLSGWYAYFQADSTGRLPGYFGTMYVWLAAITSHQVIWPFLLVLMGAKVR
jgi:hypothetical protein